MEVPSEEQTELRLLMIAIMCAAPLQTVERAYAETRRPQRITKRTHKQDSDRLRHI